MPTKQNLLIITHDLNIGGLQSVVVNICKEIDRNLFNVKVLCLRDLGVFYSQIVDLGIEVSIIPQTSGTDYLGFLKIRKYIQDNNINIIHTHNTQPFLEGVLASLFTGVKTIVHTDHARIFPDKKRYMVAEWLASFIVYKIVAVSSDTLKNLHEYEKISYKKMCVISNGISKLTILSQTKEAIRNELAISQEVYVMTFCGRFSYVKGVEYLLEAMPEIVKQIGNVKLLLIGDGELRDKYQKLIKDLHLEKYIKLLGVRTDAREILSISNLLLLPSLSEGLPMVVLEAMSSECLVAASSVGGIPNVIRHKDNGIVFEPQCPKCISEAVIYAYKNIDSVNNMKIAALKDFDENFSAAGMVREYQKLYLRDSYTDAN